MSGDDFAKEINMATLRERHDAQTTRLLALADEFEREARLCRAHVIDMKALGIDPKATDATGKAMDYAAKRIREVV